MSQNSVSSSLIDQISQQELHHLITVSTGFIDAYIVECHNKSPMLIPQNIVLSALDSPTKVKTVDWHDLSLPVYSVCHPDKTLGVALVIEGDDIDQRFALMCNEMPKTVRLRISEIVDDERENSDTTIFQYVKMGDKDYHIPHIANIQLSLGIK
ncbi:MAG: hypothetical protein ACN6NY_01960 [Acinetobacter faecalis]|uniref:CheW-like domain-containing protein n=1 Tax=Acinetobacter faecalis TaxID=2665161 RepID=A0A6L6GFF8_9GAMM|nr:hypothetical protein [Acinetobacter faecalis]MDY6456597.1 hypothetical protein [Acinetobacter faecalis]MDY6481047.1 hypothetical protein [Acinetobacter faecalis]MTD11235.1 hypothetical protein [Acinetobacter faecalis]